MPTPYRFILSREVEAGAAQYTRITSNTTTVVKQGNGIFFGIVTVAAGTSWQAAVYDNASGVGAVLVPTSTLALGGLTTGLPPGIGVVFEQGLTVITSGTAAGDAYVLWI